MCTSNPEVIRVKYQGLKNIYSQNLLQIVELQPQVFNIASSDLEFVAMGTELMQHRLWLGLVVD